MPKTNMRLDKVAKAVKGINRYDDNWYDLIFKHYRTGEVHYVRAVHYDALQATITGYLVTRRKACVGIFQNTLAKSDILVLISG